MLPTATVVLDVVVPRGTDRADAAAWGDGLRQRLEEADVSVVAPGAAGASIVSIVLTREAGEGRTDADTRFHAVRWTATLRVLRTRTRVTGAPGVSSDPASADEAARDDLLDRLVLALTL